MRDVSVALDYQQAIEGAIQLGLHGMIPDLQEVTDQDVMTFRRPEGSPAETLSYPFATYRFEDEGQINDLPTNPPRPDLGRTVEPLDPYWDSDIVLSAMYPWSTELTVSIFERMTHPRGATDANGEPIGGQIDRQAPIRAGGYARQAANWFAIHADGTVDPEDGTLRGLYFTLIDPETGDWVNQDNPPDTAVLVHLLVTHVGRITNRTTILEEGRGEHRREFTVRVGGANAYEVRVPTVERTPLEQEIQPNGRVQTDDVSSEPLYEA